MNSADNTRPADAAARTRYLKPAPSLPRLLDVNAVAELLGVPPRYVRRLVAERRIPYIKWGRYLRFDPADLDRWLDDARRRPRNGRGIA